MRLQPAPPPGFRARILSWLDHDGAELVRVSKLAEQMDLDPLLCHLYVADLWWDGEAITIVSGDDVLVARRTPDAARPPLPTPTKRKPRPVAPAPRKGRDFISQALRAIALEDDDEDRTPRRGRGRRR